MTRTRYRIDDFQETYFVLRHFNELLELAYIDFGPSMRGFEIRRNTGRVTSYPLTP